MIDTYDKNDDGMLNLEEFIPLFIDTLKLLEAVDQERKKDLYRKLEKEVLLKAITDTFNELDNDNTGFISMQ